MTEGLKSELKEIIELVKDVPERFKDKCFELLVAEVLQRRRLPDKPPSQPRETGGQVKPPLTESSIPAKVKAFARKHNVTLEQIGSLVMMEDAELYFLNDPKNVAVAKGQMQWALLLALRSALLGGDFEADPEDVRSMCKEKGFYDRANFANTFKTNANAKLFKGDLTPHGESQKLSDDGMVELASLIGTLSG